jgi:hypothetical protein
MNLLYRLLLKQKTSSLRLIDTTAVNGDEGPIAKPLQCNYYGTSNQPRDDTRRVEPQDKDEHEIKKRPIRPLQVLAEPLSSSSGT